MVEANYRRVGYAFVVADLIHIGHIRFFKKCKEYCDFLIVGVYTDELAASYKRKPIIPFEERIEMVAAIKYVDMVVEVWHKDCTPMLQGLVCSGLDVRYLFHGDDWADVEGREYIESLGGELILTPYYNERTTTGIINKIKEEK